MGEDIQVILFRGRQGRSIQIANQSLEIEVQSCRRASQEHAPQHEEAKVEI